MSSHHQDDNGLNVDADLESDPTFQMGLQAILSSTSSLSPSERQDLIERAKAFYVQQRQEQQQKNEQVEKVDDGVDLKSEQLSFSRLVEMIEKGEKIPGIREIPNKINQEKPSESKIEKRKKPWESEGVNVQSLQL